MFKTLKTLLPDRNIPLPILNGPFRGATISMNPRCSLRKVLGIYEHELNGWIEATLPRVSTILDVGANDGYFTFGCLAAFRRLGKPGTIVAFEPIQEYFMDLQSSLKNQSESSVNVHLKNYLVGSEINPEMITLDTLIHQGDAVQVPQNALIKIDVEGAELEVIAGASLWLNPQNFFLIEVHEFSFLEILTQQFLDRGIRLKQVNQQPLPVLGREGRSEFNWWLVSDAV